MILPKKIAELSGTVAACVYGDHSLLTVEKGNFHTRIWEHRIQGEAIHTIEKSSKDCLVELSGRTKRDIQIKASRLAGSDNIVIILCTIEAKVVFIPIVAK